MTRSEHASNAFAIGVDVGGTKIAAGLVGEGGAIVRSCRIPTPARDGAAAVLAAIEAAVTGLIGHADGPVAGVGIGTGGIVDHDRGIVVASTDLISGWAGTPVAASLTSRLALPVVVDNDGNVFALAESRLGSAQGYQDAVCVAVGTGIGGGLVLDGKLRRSRRHIAGEFGHLPAETSRRCSCGIVGHVEAISSGPAMVARYQEAGGTANDLAAVAAAADRGEQAAAAVIAEGGVHLGRALAGVVTAVDAEAVTIGGGVAAVGPRFVRPLTDTLFKLLPHDVRPAVHVAELGPQSAVIGAASLVLERSVCR